LESASRGRGWWALTPWSDSRTPASSNTLNFACLLVLVHVAVLGGLAHTSLGSHLSELIQAALDALCVVASLGASRRSEGFPRLFWRLAALSFCILTLAETVSIIFAFLNSQAVVQQFTEILFLFWFGPLTIALFLPPDPAPKKFAALVILDLVQAILFWVAVYLYFSLLPQQSSGTDLIHSVWNRSLIYNGVMVGAFFLRSAFTNSKTVRSLFGRMGLFLLLSGTADLYFSFPGTNLTSGDWYDLVWSSLLLLPIAIATNGRAREALKATTERTQTRDMESRQMFPLFYSFLVLTMCAQIAREHLALASTFVLISFLCSNGRMFIMQRQQERIEGALSLAENQCRAIVENALEGIFQTTPDGAYVSANPALARMYGFESPDELMSAVKDIGRQVYVDPGRRAQFKREMQEHGIVQDFEYEVHRKDGTRIWLSENARAVRDAHNAILYYEGTVQDVSDRKRGAEELRKREVQYRRLIENIPEVVWTTDERGHVLFIGEKITTIFGYTPEEIRREGSALLHGRVHADDRERVRQAYAKLFSENCPLDVEYRVQHRDGHWMRWRDRAVTFEETDGQRYADGLLSDITESRRLEEQFRQAQKMEAVGRLASGLAHDFNNLLMVIQGNSDVMRDRLEPADAQRKNVEEIQKAAQRAAALTRQLLAFSRMQVLNPKIVDLNAVVAEIAKMLQRLIGEDIELKLVPGSGLVNVKADQGQIEQVIVNLAVNARDAMPRGGKLILETSVVEVDEEYSHRNHAMQPGPYVLLTVTDTGVGMDAKTQARIFEPFFTTKQVGAGTGLGLATVYGIVKQSGGWIWVYSEPGRGTRFKIYLPQAQEVAEKAGQREARPAPPRGDETILVIEDQDSIRELIREVLERNGYKVLAASNGREALQIAASHRGAIDLLVTDVVMPQMGGRESAKQLITLRPDLRVIFMSGYAEHRGAESGTAEVSSVCLQKPFSMNTLLHKIREVLEGIPVSPA
jgi:two-component system, cell cycle sensor histidine kinase and response regulator CckA